MRRIDTTSYGLSKLKAALKSILPDTADPAVDASIGTLVTLVSNSNELVDARVLERLAALEAGSPAPPPDPGPEPEPTPTPGGYAPRAYNSTDRADARFCMKAEFGVSRSGAGFVDARGVQYDEAGRDLGGRTKTIVAELKGADSMDGREPCDQYVGPTGRTIGGSAGYPAASFER